jgi:Outer membrane protein beta-barrel domain
MKKLLVLVTALIVVFAVTAQENKVQKELKSYMMLSLGPSFPVGDYASIDENNENAGYAKTGFNIDLSYGYRFVPEFAIELSGLYNFNGIDKSILQGLDAKVDHFQIVGFMAGPTYMNNVSDKVAYNFRLKGGYARVNSPSLKFEGETLVTEDWADGFIWNFGLNAKFDISKKAFFAINADYYQTRPEFKVEALGETVRAVQRIAVANVNVGFGIKI